MDKFLKEIGISYTGEYATSGDLVVDLPDADAYNKAFGKLDKSPLLDENEDMSVTNEDISNIMYESEKYFVNLIADFDSNIYKIVVSKLDGEEEN